MVRENNNVNCVLALNKIFLVGAVACMTSVLVNLDEKKRARFFVFHTELENGDIEKILKLKEVVDCEIIIMDVREHLHYFKEVDFSNSPDFLKYYETFLRFLIFKILPEDVEKCVYLDSDLIVNCDLGHVIDNLLSNNLIGAVKDYNIVNFVEFNNDKELLKKYLNAVNIKYFNEYKKKYSYFNAGFLLINIKLAKSMNIFEELLKYLKKYPGLTWLDQDILNIVFSKNNFDKIMYLGLEYNFFAVRYNCYLQNYKILNEDNSNYISLSDIFNPKVIHFAGGIEYKPWINVNSKNYYGFKWHHYFDMYLRLYSEHNQKEILLWRDSYESSGRDSYESSKAIKKGSFYINLMGINFLRMKEVEKEGVVKKKWYIINFLPIFKIKKKKTNRSYYILGLRTLKIKNG